MWRIDMKRFTLVCSLAVLSLTAHAQVGDYRSEFAVGISGGINLTGVDFNPSLKEGKLMGKNAGIILRYTCEKYIKAICAIQVEVNYSQQGLKGEEDESSDYFSKTMSYVQVPFLARLAWGRERKGAQGYIVLGPQIGFLLSESQEHTGSWMEKSRTHTYQYSHNADRAFDYGITLGAGAEISTPKLGHFQIEARYFYGLHDFYDNSAKGYFGRSGHNAITVKIGYLIDLFKSKNPNIR